MLKCFDGQTDGWMDSDYYRAPPQLISRGHWQALN